MHPLVRRAMAPAARTWQRWELHAICSMNPKLRQTLPRKGRSLDCNQRHSGSGAPKPLMKRSGVQAFKCHRRAVVSRRTRGAARAGKIAKRTALGVVRRRGLWPARTSRKCGNALSAKRLAIRAGRPGPRGRTAGRAGATPPENGPRLRSRTLRGGRSRDLSLQEGWAVPGPWMRPSRMFGAHVNATDV